MPVATLHDRLAAHPWCTVTTQTYSKLLVHEMSQLAGVNLPLIRSNLMVICLDLILFNAKSNLTRPDFNKSVEACSAEPAQAEQCWRLSNQLTVLYL